MEDFTYTCSCCGKVHSGVPDLAFDHPHHYHVLDADQRVAAKCDDDLCTIGDDHFVRGVLQLPIHGREAPFGFGVWVSLSPGNFARYVEQFEERLPNQDAPWFGWLCNQLPGYSDTLMLKTNVSLRPFPSRPLIKLEPTAHQLSVDQRDGISLERLQHLLEINRHPPTAS